MLFSEGIDGPTESPYSAIDRRFYERGVSAIWNLSNASFDWLITVDRKQARTDVREEYAGNTDIYVYLRISTLKIADVRSGKCEGDSIICILTMTGT